MRSIRNPPTHPLQINLTLRILINPNHKPLLLQSQQQPLNKLLIPRQLPSNINRKNQPRKNTKQISQNLLRNPLNLNIRNNWHPITKQNPLKYFTKTNSKSIQASIDKVNEPPSCLTTELPDASASNHPSRLMPLSNGMNYRQFLTFI